MKKSSPPNRYWKTQLPVDYIDTSLVQNAWENVVADLSEGRPARLLRIIIEQTNNGATPESLELEITINGTAYVFALACDSDTQYYGYINMNLTAGDFSPFLTATVVRPLASHTGVAVQSYPFVAASVGLIRVRQTTDVDVTSAQIEVNIVWDRLEP